MRRSFLLLLAFAPIACQPVAEPGIDPGPPTARQLYMARCIACHQVDGSGIPAICPPLPTSPKLTSPPEDLIRILLLGMKGRIVRDGKTFCGIMPAWKFDLNDGQIAEAINDLYARWNPGAPQVTEEMVRRIREETASQKLFPTPKEE
ncbi:MAG: cytochrome c [Verrucomicrobiota bacterium]